MLGVCLDFVINAVHIIFTDCAVTLMHARYHPWHLYDPCNAYYYIAASPYYHNSHCNIANVPVTCMITSEFRVVRWHIQHWCMPCSNACALDADSIVTASMSDRLTLSFTDVRIVAFSSVRLPAIMWRCWFSNQSMMNRFFHHVRRFVSRAFAPARHQGLCWYAIDTAGMLDLLISWWVVMLFARAISLHELCFGLPDRCWYGVRVLDHYSFTMTSICVPLFM